MHVRFIFHNVILIHVFGYCPINMRSIHYIPTVEGTDSFIYFAATQDELIKGMPMTRKKLRAKNAPIPRTIFRYKRLSVSPTLKHSHAFINKSSASCHNRLSQNLRVFS